MPRNIKRNQIAGSQTEDGDEIKFTDKTTDLPWREVDRTKWVAQGTTWQKKQEQSEPYPNELGRSGSSSIGERARQAVEEMRSSSISDRVLHWTEDTPLETRVPERRAVGKAVLFGLAGGAAATIVMTQYQNALAKMQNGGQKPKSAEQKKQAVSEQSTVKIADKIARATANREIPQEQKQFAGNVVHYAYGTLMGGVYGALTSLFREAPFGTGVLFGIGLWVVGDEVVLPALGISKPPSERSLKQHAEEASMHAVYGVCLDAVNLLQRKVA